MKKDAKGYPKFLKYNRELKRYQSLSPEIRYQRSQTHKEFVSRYKQDLVYLIYNPISQMHKIGRTNNIYLRLSCLSGATGTELELIHIAPTSSNKELEGELKLLFHEFRIKGEWYKLTPEKLEEVKNYMDNFVDSKES